MTDTAFRTCGSCAKVWLEWRDFVLDADLRLLGLQVTPQIADANLLVFEHVCGTSVSVLAARLRPHLGGPGATTLPSRFGSLHCPQHCRLREDLQVCDQPCVNARDRWMALRIEEIRRTGELPAPGPEGRRAEVVVVAGR